MHIALRQSALAWLLFVLSSAAPALAQAPHTHHHSFGDAQEWARIFDDPQRDAWQKPHEVIQALAPKPDALIADIGAGTGYFAMRFGQIVPQGRVYAIDTESAMVKHLAERAQRGLGVAPPAVVAGQLRQAEERQCRHGVARG